MPRPDRILMGPGPGNPYPEAIEAFMRPMLGHLDPAFLELLDEVCDQLRTVFGTTNALTIPISGTGSAGMETCIVNVLGPGDVAVIGVNGVFGARMCDVASRTGAEVVRVDFDWGTPVTADRLLDAHPSPTLIGMVHAETSTGARSDVEPVAAGKGDALLLVDCVTSLGGIPFEADAWGIDLAYSGTQKCLGVPPGLSPITVSDRARDRFVERSQSWYLDLRMIGSYVGTAGAKRTYHHTAPISMIYSLHGGLTALLDEGIEAVHARHAGCGQLLQDGLVELGFELFATEGHRLPELTTVVVPDGVDEAAVRARLLERYDIEVGGGLGEYAGKVWRIGCMGHTARPRNVTLLLGALREVLGR